MSVKRSTLEYGQGEKFLEIARKNKEILKEHIDEFKKQTFLEDKVRVLERALEYALLAIEYFEMGIELREDREAFYKEMKNLFVQKALERVKVLMALACKSSPAQPVTHMQIAKWVYGGKGEEKIRTVMDTIVALENFVVEGCC